MRTFIAIMLPKRVNRIVARRQATLKEALQHRQLDDAVRWPAPVDLHLTLRFLGDTTERQRSQIKEELLAASDAWTPLSLSLGGYGCFPNIRRPTVVWLGVDGGLSQLRALQGEIEQIVQRAGFEPEKRRFHPHLTIGRADRRASAVQLREVGSIVQSLSRSDAVIDQEETVEFLMDEIVHMRSQLRPTGAVYSSLDVFPISPAASGS